MVSRWHTGARTLTCDHACHLARASLGGEDWAMPAGTPLYAPVAGVIRFRLGGTGGWTLTLNGDDGREYEVMHCSGAVGLTLGGGSRRAAAREHVGYSGGAVGHPGAGSSTGPHAHEHYTGANGVRRPITDLLTGAAGGDTTPFEETDDDMTLFKASSDSTDKLIKNGWLYKQSGDGPVIPVSNLESVFVTGAKDIGGNDLRVLANVYGLAEAEAPGPWTWGGGKGYLGPGKLTGRRIGPDGKAYWPYPASSGAGDSSAVLAAIAEVDKDVAAVASGVAGVPAATAAELSKRLSA